MLNISWQGEESFLPGELNNRNILSEAREKREEYKS